MNNSFQNKKELRFVITLGNARTFQGGSANQITLEGYRAVVDIDRGGGMMAGTLNAQIYGVPQSDMNACVTYQYQPLTLSSGYIFNTIKVFAIEGAQETLVFTGNIHFAMGNYLSQPDVFLEIQAQSLYAEQLTPAPPTSFNGSFDVASAMDQFANKLGLTLEPNGVNVQLKDQYLPNTIWEQTKTLAQAANIDIYLDPPVLAITPPNTARGTAMTSNTAMGTGGTPILSKDTGMVGYPTFNSQGVLLKALFNPAVRYGGSIQIVSDIPNANGTFIARGIAYRLESEKPNGAWFMTILATKGNYAFWNGG